MFIIFMLMLPFHAYCLCFRKQQKISQVHSHLHSSRNHIWSARHLIYYKCKCISNAEKKQSGCSSCCVFQNVNCWGLFQHERVNCDNDMVWRVFVHDVLQCILHTPGAAAAYSYILCRINFQMSISYSHQVKIMRCWSFCWVSRTPSDTHAWNTTTRTQIV